MFCVRQGRVNDSRVRLWQSSQESNHRTQGWENACLICYSRVGQEQQNGWALITGQDQYWCAWSRIRAPKRAVLRRAPKLRNTRLVVEEMIDSPLLNHPVFSPPVGHSTKSSLFLKRTPIKVLLGPSMWPTWHTTKVILDHLFYRLWESRYSIYPGLPQDWKARRLPTDFPKKLSTRPPSM